MKNPLDELDDDELLTDEERRKKDALQLVADRVVGKAPVNPLEEAFRNGPKFDPASGIPFPLPAVPSAPPEGALPPSSVVQPDDTIAGAVDRAMGAQPERVGQPEHSADFLAQADRRRNRDHRSASEIRDAQLRGQVEDYLKRGEEIDPATGRPFLSDIDRLAAEQTLSSTNRLQYLTTNTVKGGNLAAALGMPTETPEIPTRDGTYGGDRYDIGKAIEPAIQQTTDEWLESIKTGNVQKIGAENVRQEEITTETKQRDLELERGFPQTGPITMRPAYDADGNVVGYYGPDNKFHSKSASGGDLATLMALMRGETPPAPAPAAPSIRDGQTATGPNGEKIVFRNGEWVNL